MRTPTGREFLLTVLLAFTAVLTFLRPPPKFEITEAMAQVTCAALPYTFVSGTVASANQLNANFNAVVSCIQSVKSSPYVNTLVDLKAASTLSYTTGVWRLTYQTGSTAPPLFYVPSGSACTQPDANGDNGSQVKSANGKCWIAVFPTSGVDARQFGLLSTGDGTVSAQAASDAIYTLKVGGSTLLLPIGFNINTTVYVYGNMTVRCGGAANPITRVSTSPAFHTVDAPGHTYAQAGVFNFKMDNCYVGPQPTTNVPTMLDGTDLLLEAVEGYSVTNSYFVNSGAHGSSFTGSVGASFTCSGSGTTLTVTGIAANTIIHPGATGALLFGTGVPASTYIASQSSGPTGGNGTYVTNQATTASSAACSTTSDQLDVTANTRGTIAAGQMLLCPNCGNVTNTYPVIASGSSTPFTLTATLSSTISPQDMIGVSSWTFTNGDGTRSYPSANLTCIGGFWGCFDGKIDHVGVGYNFQKFFSDNATSQCGPTNANAYTSTIGLYFDSSQPGGGNKFNQNLISSINAPCNYIGVFNANGADNQYLGVDCEFDKTCAAIGLGDNTANTILFDRPYCEGFSSSDKLVDCLMITTTTAARGLTVRGMGSTNSTTFLINPEAGSYVEWNLPYYQVYRSAASKIFNFEPAAIKTLALTPVPVVNQGIATFGLNGSPVSVEAQAFGNNAIPHILGAYGNGTAAAPTVVTTDQTVARHDGALQYDSTQGHMGKGAAVDVRVGSGVISASNFHSYLVLATVPASSTTLTDRFKIDTGFFAAGLADPGVGGINATLYKVNDHAGVDCTIVGATAHLTVEKGLVTLCN